MPTPSSVVWLLDHSAPQPAQRFTWGKFRAWIKTQFTLAHTVHSCYEAGHFGYGLHRELVALGVKNVIVQPDRSQPGGQILFMQ